MGNISTRQKILLIILVVVVGYAFYSTFIEGGGGGQAPASALRSPAQTIVPQQMPVQQQMVAQQRLPVQPRVAGAGQPFPPSLDIPLRMNDPFFRVRKKTAAADSQVQPDRLAQIVYKGLSEFGGKKMALLNNDVYEINDEIDGLRLIEINEKSVVFLDRDGTKYTLMR